MTVPRGNGSRFPRILAVLAGLLFPALAYSALTVNSASVVDATTVGQGKVFTLTVTVGGSGVAANNRTWRSTQVLANAVPLQCVDLSDDALAGGIVNLTPTRTFNVAAPAALNTYAITVVANNNDTCTGATSSSVVAATPNLVVAANPVTPIAFVGVATGVKPSGASNPQEVTVAVPAGSVGDVLLAIITTDGPTDVSPTAAAAWTLLDRSATTGGLMGDLSQATVGVWYRVATGTEAASYAFGWTTDNNPPPEQQATGAILRYSGVDTKNPINAFATNSNLSQSLIAPSVTTTVTGAMIVRAYGSDSYATPLTFPAGTGPAVAAATVVTDPAPHGRFGIWSNSATLLNAVGSGGSDVVQAGGPGATGTATFTTTVHPVPIPQQWRAVTVALAPAIDLQISKTESADPIVAGSGPGNLTYVVTLKNNGVSTATTIAVNEVLTLPPGVTAIVTPSAGTWTAPTWTVPTLAAGASQTLTVVLTADSSTAPGTNVIGDTATITSADQSLLNTGDDTVTVSTSVVTSAQVSVTNGDAPDPVTAGTNLTYTIQVTNAGPSNAAAAGLADTLPANTTFVSLASPPGWSCTTPAFGGVGAVSCSLSSLAPGTATFTLIVKVDAATPVGTVLSDTATASSTTTDPSPGNESGIATTTVATAADLSVTKLDTPDPIAAGTNLSYTITVTNAGPSNAAAASLSDALPANTTFVSLASPAGWSCTTPAVGATGSISCSSATLAPGNAAFTLTVLVAPATPAGTVLSNTATVSSTTSDPNPANQGTATTTVSAAADLSVAKLDTPDPIAAGTNLTYTITVTNAGPSNAATVSLSDPLPANTTFVSLASPGGWSCTTPAVGATGSISCSAATLAPGIAMFTLTVLVAPATPVGTVLSNTATVSSTTSDPNPANQGTATTTVSAAGDLSVTQVDTPDPVTAGTNLQYAITATNAGPSVATGVSLSDPLPAGTRFVSLTTPAGWSCTTPAVGANGTVSCSVAAFAAGSAAFTLTVSVDSGVATGTNLANTATLSSATSDPAPANNTFTANTAVGTGSADLSVLKTASPNPVAAGGVLTYTITVNNAGPSAAAGATLSDTLPASTTFASLAPAAGWTCTTPSVGGTGTVSCSIPTFNTGTAVFTLAVTVSASIAPGTVISNIATVSSTTPDPTPANQSNSAGAMAVSQSALSATKTVTGQFLPGTPVTYTIVVPNSGPGAQADNPGNELTDVLPSSLTLVGASASSGTAVANIGTNTVTWNGSIAPGGSVTVTIQATIPIGAGGTVSNQGTIAFDADGNGTNESTALTDDPSVAGSSNPTTFQIVIPPPVPMLDGSALFVLAALLALCGVIATWKMK